MRAVFGVLSVLIVVLIVGLLIKKQLSPAPVKDAGMILQVPAAGTTPQQQSQQAQQQVRQQLEGVLQQARPMPEDK